MAQQQEQQQQQQNQDQDQQQNQQDQVVIVIRHGERLDYVERDAGRNYLTNNKTPWDPPLSNYGHEQAKQLGKHINHIINDMKLPPLKGIYTSPFTRCQQTAIGIRQGLLHSTITTTSTNTNGTTTNNNETTNTNNISNSNNNININIPKICIEEGLAESLNENWYRSWSLPKSNGTWGYLRTELPIKELDSNILHISSKQPVQTIINNLKTTTCCKNNNNNEQHFNTNYKTQVSITIPYSFHPPNFESFKVQRTRMTNTMTTLSKNNQTNNTIILISHGGPVTHLYENLTGNNWQVHGESTYCCYSIYRKNNDTTTTTTKGEEEQEENTTTTTTTTTTQKECTKTSSSASNWNPLIVNYDLFQNDKDKTKKPIPNNENGKR